MTSAKLYPLLSIAQRLLAMVLATRLPWLSWTSATLATADSGKTWTEAGQEWIGPICVYRDSTRKGPPLPVGAEYDAGAFCCREGLAGIRLTVGRSQATAPFILRNTMPTKLDGSNPPSIQPPEVRQALVYHAVGQWAKQGGYRDPAPYFGAYNDFLFGDPATGEVGFVGQYLTQRRSGTFVGSGWWRSADLGR